MFGDLPASEWPSEDGQQATTEPWASFVAARKHGQAGKTDLAVAELERIAATPSLESRHYLQAWHFLRLLKVKPPADKAKVVHGVVVEVGLPGGADIVAAYADGTARYLHHTGAGVFWERPDSSLDAEIQALLTAGHEVASRIGPWEQARPEAPTNGNVRLNMLTPSGLHFGYGSFEALSKDPMGKAIIDPATQLMVRLTELRKTVRM
ncbi:hypothetical protein [Accumulibacter sp.]|uniref:hypothetical protein n=1 Tax=Accumulibacter sp. TaxID=2053492 RepID=UPI0026107EBF|nr:hypothetical protein [Accumulibacter sp.]